MKLKIEWVLALILIFPSFVVADTSFFQDVSLQLNGYYRVRHYTLSNITGDKNSPDHEINYFTHQLRIKPDLNINEKVSLSIDVLGLSGVFGNNPGNILSMSTSDTYADIILKRAYMKVMLPAGVLMAGRMPSHFGLGIFSNDGDHPVEFGDTNIDNTYDRILFATKPLGKNSSLLVALFYDKLVESEHLPALEGTISTDIGDSKDDINDWGLVVKYGLNNFLGKLKMGFYFLNRWQSSTDTNLYIPDVYVSWSKNIFHAAFELAFINGKTSSIPVFLNNLIKKPSIDISSFGGVLDIGAKLKPLDDLYMEVGYASGDKPGAEAFDDLRYSQFSIDRNHEVGLLLFQYAYSYFTSAKAAAAVQYLQQNETNLKALQTFNGLSDTYVDEYISYVHLLMPSRGSISNAFYIFPVVRYKPVDSLLLKFAVLGAWVTGKDHRVETNRVVSVVNGAPVYAHGSNYGWEFDLGVSLFYTKNVTLGIQGGYLIPGDIFQKPDGKKADNEYTIIPRLTVKF